MPHPGGPYQHGAVRAPCSLRPLRPWLPAGITIWRRNPTFTRLAAMVRKNDIRQEGTAVIAPPQAGYFQVGKA